MISNKFLQINLERINLVLVSVSKPIKEREKKLVLNLKISTTSV